jgi:hypothetical protein
MFRRSSRVYTHNQFDFGTSASRHWFVEVKGDFWGWRMDCNRLALFFATYVLLPLAALICVEARAQVAGGTLSGRITDASGAPMPNVQVLLENVASGTTQIVTTNTEGFYAAPSLPPQTYKMTISASGFTTQVRTGIALAVGARQIVNIVMEPGKAARTVQTSSAADPASQTASTVTRNVSASTVRNSPLNGRDWTQLATLLPGVIGISTASTAPGTGGLTWVRVWAEHLGRPPGAKRLSP